MSTHRYSARARILVPLFIGFLVMTVAFVGISYVSFRNYTIEDCVNYAYGLNSLIADDLDIDHIDDYIQQGRTHPDYEAIERHLYKLRDAYPDIVYSQAFRTEPPTMNTTRSWTVALPTAQRVFPSL